MARKLFIRPNGDIEAVLDKTLDALSHEFGSKEIYRASLLNFNNKTKAWDARFIKTDELITSEETREEAVKAEVSFIENDIKKNIEDDNRRRETEANCSLSAV